MSCPDSTASLVTGISAVVVLFVSELLPFLPIQQNGIVHSLILALKTALPTTTTTTRPTATTTVESPIPPPVTATV